MDVRRCTLRYSKIFHEFQFGKISLKKAATRKDKGFDVFKSLDEDFLTPFTNYCFLGIEFFMKYKNEDLDSTFEGIHEISVNRCSLRFLYISATILRIF